MSHLFESIRVINGQVRNLRHHQLRVDRAFEELSKEKPIQLKKYIRGISIPKNGVHKLRISYDVLGLVISHTITPYVEKPIHSLKIVHTTDRYSHKYEDRDFIKKAYADKRMFDDVLFVHNNLVMDTSYCNVAFFDGKKWLTPKAPLLMGTMRAQLLDKGIIEEKEIRIEEIGRFVKCRLFNALIKWSGVKEVKVEEILR